MKIEFLVPLFSWIIIFSSCNSSGSKGNDSLTDDRDPLQESNEASTYKSEDIETDKLSPEDLEQLENTISKLYYNAKDIGYDGLFTEETMRRIEKFGSESLINATRQNYKYARQRISEMEPYVDPNPLTSDIFVEGTDGTVLTKYKGFSLGEVKKDGQYVEAHVNMKVDVYETEYDEENFKLYQKEKLRVILKFFVDESDSKKTYYLDDIMFEDPQDDIPKGKWLKKEMENNKLLKPAYRA